jgi:hypothetical protein
MGTK